MSNEEKYIDMMEAFWELNDTYCFTPTEQGLYIYLLRIWFRRGCSDSFDFSDEKLSATINVSRNAMKKARERLVECGVIVYNQGGCGRGAKTVYQITCQNLTPKMTPKRTPNDITCQNLTPKMTPKRTPTKEKNQKKIYKQEILSSNELPPANADGVVENPKSSTKKKKAPTIISKARGIFEAHYNELYDNAYYWTAKDGMHMKQLIQKITHARASKGMAVDEDSVLAGLKALLGSIESGFIVENFSVSIINSKYNEIVSQAKASKHKSNGNIRTNDSGREERTAGAASLVARLIAENKPVDE